MSIETWRYNGRSGYVKERNRASFFVVVWLFGFIRAVKQRLCRVCRVLIAAAQGVGSRALRSAIR